MLRIALIIASLAVVVNATEISFGDQVQIAVLKGEDYLFHPDLLKESGLSAGLSSRALEVTEDHSTDGLSHDFHVILKNQKPMAVILTAENKTEKISHTVIYRTNKKGKLKSAFSQDGRYDSSGKPIAGSGVLTDLKLTPEVKADFQHELDFWLKGMYRKAQ